MTYVGTHLKSARLQEHYDAIVIGSGMGGLSVASVLSQKGRRVLLLEQHNVIGGCTHAYARKGYEWNIGLHYIGDLHSPVTMTSKLFDYVSDSSLQWEPMPEVYNRIFIGDREYPFSQGEGAYARELKQWFPEEHQAIDRYMELLAAAVASSRNFFAEKAMPRELGRQNYQALSGEFLKFSERTTYDVLSELTDNQELIAVICGNYGDYSLPPKRSAFAMHAMLVRHYYRSAYYPTGGAASLAKAIVPVIEAKGGDVVYGAAVSQVLVESDCARGVRLSSGEKVMATCVISNAGVQNTFGDLLPDDLPVKTQCEQQLQQVNDAYCAVGLNIGLKADAASLGLSGGNIWAHPGADLDGNIEAHKNDFEAPFPWSFITFPSAKDSSWPERFPGKATIEMFAATDFAHFESWANTPWQKRGQAYESLKADIAKRMFAELYKYAPQIEPYVDYFEVSTPVSYQHFLRRKSGNFMGIEASPQRFQQQWLRADTPIENLFLTGQDITTDGVISALMAGVMTASRVLGENVMAEVARRQSD
ncbi:NAD(P)/FAD-dependent oxidoreductase [Pseudomaricurvus alkylphenolicus]|uniref:phytoene desaturase family protein n=1 Tax=Pseudomaricurvus alkylphenolicus TaxID=1306991 RepID=UPI00141F0048|nr:NAD(P)/FAD-dependent oxidoreductase [Pseudomaricurvus alkylphenolicus]NIB37945.1 NAD(P)/FAD-dependent oxidoreductase [Pseudomaricurvus alkylphenolicus]